MNTIRFIISAIAVVTLFLSAGTVSAQSSLQQPKGAISDSSDQIAERIVNSKLPVLIDFWAPWCGPCRQLNPIIKELEKEYKGKITFMKVNVDQHRGIAGYFQVSSIPAVFFVKEKTVINVLKGLYPKEMYKKALDEAIAAKVTAPAPGNNNAAESGK